jgi:hypothetical protein
MLPEGSEVSYFGKDIVHEQQKVESISLTILSFYR